MKQRLAASVLHEIPGNEVYRPSHRVDDLRGANYDLVEAQDGQLVWQPLFAQYTDVIGKKLFNDGLSIGGSRCHGDE